MIALVTAALLTGCFNSKKDEGQATATSTPAATSEGTSSASAASADPLASWPELKITVMGYAPAGSDVAKEDVLTPIWREKTKVTPEIVSVIGKPPMQQWVVANTVPQIIAAAGHATGTETFKLLKENNKLREITRADVERYMPRYVEWLTELGGTLDQLFEDNRDLQDGKLWFLPNLQGPKQLPAYQGTDFELTVGGMNQYNFYFRDDILKEIFPNVRTEAELRKLYLDQGGKLSYEDISDVPINSREELLDYLRKVKALNKKVGNKPVLAQFQSTSENPNSLLWSMFSVAGYVWTETGERTQKGNQLTYTPITSEWKEYYRFWNTAYNEGLIDPEAFIQKDDQASAKIINGEYAVFNGWGPVNDARALSEKEGRGYGFRLVPMFANHPMVNAYQDMTYQPYNMDGSAVGYLITTGVDEKDLPQVLNWFDWNFSKEAAELRAWGPREWSTGEGKERRFKPEYKAIEEWAVAGIKSGKDGNYYGLYDNMRGGDAANGAPFWNHETHGIEGLPYEDKPVRVYPPTLSEKANTDSQVLLAENIRFKSQVKYYRQVDWTFAHLDPEGKFNEVDSVEGVYSADAKSKVVNVIVGKPEDFDKNYQAYLDLYSDRWHAEWAAMQQRWKEIYDTKIQPEIAKSQ